MTTLQTRQRRPVTDSTYPGVLHNGARVQMRPLQPTDRHHLLALFARLSETSRRDRFLTAMPQLPGPLLDKLVDTVDGDDHVALALFITPPGQDPMMIGVGRFARSPHDRTSAEVAVTIDDAYHGLGAGTLLTQHLAAAAHYNGIDSFTATVLTANTRCLRMLRRVGTVTEWHIVGAAVECRIELHETALRPDTAAA